MDTLVSCTSKDVPLYITHVVLYITHDPGIFSSRAGPVPVRVPSLSLRVPAACGRKSRITELKIINIIILEERPSDYMPDKPRPERKDEFTSLISTVYSVRFGDSSADPEVRPRDSSNMRVCS